MSLYDRNAESLTLDSFFAVDTTGSLDSSAFTEMNTSNFCYKDIRQALHELECKGGGIGVDVAGAAEEYDDETKNILKYTRAGIEKLKVNIAKYVDLIGKKNDLVKNKDVVYKGRNTLIHELRKMFKDSYIEESADISTRIEELVKQLGDTYEEQLDAVDCEIKNTKKTLRILGEAYCIFKNSKTCQVCPICFTNELSIYCNPCGHAFCATCLRSSSCPICRSHIAVRGKLYL
jgi:hypothetical protein